ncbi:hypothetical protein ACFFSW_33885 [Saccharothrix longispora]|uniref:DUF3800 domain-containing protein n=1 Tax=Saccharothrix longispora TaxID=33920 RepID=A0ABU1Q2Q1_9PSEU|nr:hypothetical protein [Saccharothrix longispora]MDR6597139.1 hypothetical protein [Saccharothrix longispora]
MTVHAFVDESRRNDTYYLGVALVDPGALAPLRALLRGLLLPGQRELHFNRETPQRRRLVLSRLAHFGARVDVYRADCRKSEELARRTCVERLVNDLLDLGAARLVLDSRVGRDYHDVRTIRDVLGTRPSESSMAYEHFDSTGDPLLWLADLAVWSYGAGGDWGRRVAPVIGSVIRLDWS